MRAIHPNKPLIAATVGAMLLSFAFGRVAPSWPNPEPTPTSVSIPESTHITNSRLSIAYVTVTDGRRFVYRNAVNGTGYYIRVDTWGDGSATAELEVVPTPTPRSTPSR